MCSVATSVGGRANSASKADFVSPEITGQSNTNPTTGT